MDYNADEAAWREMDSAVLIAFDKKPASSCNTSGYNDRMMSR
jgi:hypothetical protein